MYSAPKSISALLLPVVFLMSGCARHHASAQMSMEQTNGHLISDATDRSEVTPVLPGERIATSAPPTTGRYAATEPAAIPLTRIVIRVADRGVIHRSWPLAVCPRPSGEVLAGPTYWPSEDRAFYRRDTTNLWLEPGEFLWNILLLPYRVIDTPPWAKIVYSPAGSYEWRNVEQSGVIFQEHE